MLAAGIRGGRLEIDHSRGSVARDWPHQGGFAMTLGRRRREVQSEFWIETGAIAQAPGHLFYDRLNTLLEEAGFDRFVGDLELG